MTLIRCPGFQRRIILNIFLHMFIGGTLNAQPAGTLLRLKSGHSDVVDLAQPIKRIAIADPEIADANVISATQIVVIGKSIGTTSMIVWDENDDYINYTVIVESIESRKQIILRVRFMEVNKSALKEFGSDFIVKGVLGNESYEVGNFAGEVVEPFDPLLLGSTVDIFFNVPSSNFSSVFKALNEKNLITLLASPNLSAQSGTEASFLAGGEFPVPIVSGAQGMQTVTIYYKEFGVKLKFFPLILGENLININVKAEVSSLDFENGVTLSGFKIPALVSRKAETTVELEKGQYLIIGGLLSNEITQTVAKVPVLGHIPILGQLFSSKRFLNKESELLIALSPDIAHSIPEEEVPELNLGEDTKK